MATGTLSPSGTVSFKVSLGSIGGVSAPPGNNTTAGAPSVTTSNVSPAVSLDPAVKYCVLVLADALVVDLVDGIGVVVHDE